MKKTIVTAEGSTLNPTKVLSSSERAAIIAKLDEKIGGRKSLMEDSNFATSGRAIFRLDSPRNKPIFEIQRNGDRAPGEQTTVACVCEIPGFQELLNVFPNSEQSQLEYNEILWSKLKSSFEAKKNMNVTVKDLEKILSKMERHFTKND